MTESLTPRCGLSVREGASGAEPKMLGTLARSRALSTTRSARSPSRSAGRQ
jgi:hypothetical protein